MGYLFEEILIRPLFNTLVWFYNTIAFEDLGIAIVLLTILIRLILTPLTLKMLRAQKEMARLQPELKAIQKKHKDDQQALTQATMALYKEHNVNPLGGCLPILIQLPIVLALYRVFIRGLEPETLDLLYPFVAHPGQLNPLAFGFLNLGSSLAILALIAGAAQGVQAYITLRTQRADAQGQDNPALKMTQQMLYFFPILIVFISWTLPAGLVLYWIVTTLFSIFEHTVIRKRFIHVDH